MKYSVIFKIYNSSSLHLVHSKAFTLMSTVNLQNYHEGKALLFSTLFYGGHWNGGKRS